MELRLHPERLTGEIASFLDEVWSSRSARSPARRKRTAKRAGSASG